jgi:hypothetical protein
VLGELRRVPTRAAAPRRRGAACRCLPAALVPAWRGLGDRHLCGDHSLRAAAIVRLSRIAPSCPWITNSPPPSLAMIAGHAQPPQPALPWWHSPAVRPPSRPASPSPQAPHADHPSPLPSSLRLAPPCWAQGVEVAVRRTLLSRILLRDARINAAAQLMEARMPVPETSVGVQHNITAL